MTNRCFPVVIIALFLHPACLEATTFQTLIAGETFQVDFEDVFVPEQHWQFLAREIGRAFSYVSSQNIDQLFMPEPTDTNGLRHIRPTYDLWYPSVVYQDLGISTTPTNLVYVYRSLSDHFLNDTNLLVSYETSYSGITNFLASFNAGALTNLTSSSIRSMFFMSEEAADSLTDATVSQALSQWTGVHFFMPSFLDFSIQQSAVYGGVIPAFRVKLREADGKITDYPIANFNGEWKIVWYE